MTTQENICVWSRKFFNAKNGRRWFKSNAGATRFFDEKMNSDQDLIDWQVGSADSFLDHVQDQYDLENITVAAYHKLIDEGVANGGSAPTPTKKEWCVWHTSLFVESPQRYWQSNEENARECFDGIIESLTRDQLPDDEPGMKDYPEDDWEWGDADKFIEHLKAKRDDIGDDMFFALVKEAVQHGGNGL